MHVPFVDLSLLHQPLKKQFLRAAEEIIDTNEFIAGKRTAAFEQHFAAAVGGTYALLVNNGTSALFMALKALQLPIGSKVLLPVNTFIATAEAVTLAGLIPVFIDIDEQTLLMDIDACVQKIDADVSAIIPVNLYGRQFPIKKLKKQLNTFNRKIFIIEDACQSHGAFEGKQPQINADITCYSFYPGKNLGALGEAGGIVTNAKKWYNWMMLYRSHGSKIKYVHEMVGMNFRSSEMEAAFLDIKLPQLPAYNAQRFASAKIYYKLLADISQATLPILPDTQAHAFHLMIACVRRRKQLQAFLTAHGVQTALHYPTLLHQTKAYASLGYRKGDFPVAEKKVKEILSLPMYAGIPSSHIEYVCKMISEFYAKG